MTVCITYVDIFFFLPRRCYLAGMIHVFNNITFGFTIIGRRETLRVVLSSSHSCQSHARVWRVATGLIAAIHSGRVSHVLTTVLLIQQPTYFCFFFLDDTRNTQQRPCIDMRTNVTDIEITYFVH